MAELTTKDLSLSSPAIPFAAADALGDSVANERGLVVLVKNDDAAGITATVVSQVVAEPGLQPADLAVAVAAGEIVAISLDGNNRFSDGDGLVQLTYDSVTSVEVAAIIP